MYFRDLLLDPFQEKAIKHIEQGRSVLISAPTGTGKTLIADFLAEMHIFQKGRIIYTAPIKALSNQKYREYTSIFGENNVGLITGDFKVNTDASFLIMTTEILRNILYSDDYDFIDSITSVIYDEIHYIGDESRGVAWEESIIKLPEKVQIIGLSATVPNIRELAEWISIIKNKKVFHIKENKRAVPLKIHIFAKRHELYEINNKDDVRDFINGFFSKLNSGHGQFEKNKPSASHYDVIRYLGKTYLPLLFFVFNRRQTEEYARFLAGKVDFLNKADKENIRQELEKIQSYYSGLYHKEMADLQSILEKGIAFHHSGMNPVYKRLVEILVEKGIVNVLYCTSTFALGLNFPVKTVVFGSISKFNGTATLPLTAQQFHQKAGRAGRRGIDKVGNVIITSKLRDFVPSIIEKYITGNTERVKSAFDLSYNSVVNILHSNSSSDIDDVLLKSFWAFQEKPELRQQFKHLEQYKDKLKALTKYTCDYDDGLYKKRMTDENHKLKTIDKNIRANKRKIKNLERHIKLQKKTDKNEKQIAKYKINLANLEKQKEHLLNSSQNFGCVDCRNYKDCAFNRKDIKKLNRQIVNLSKAIKTKESYLSDEFWQKVDILKKLSYINEDNSFNEGAYILKEVQINELLLTELILDGVFERLNYNEINALCASIGGRGSKNSIFNNRLEELKECEVLIDTTIEKLVKIRAIASRKEMELDFSLSGYAYAWSGGMSWNEILLQLSKYENPISVSGDLVYSFRRCIDILRQVMNVYRNNIVMYNKIKDCITRMDRDIISMIL